MQHPMVAAALSAIPGTVILDVGQMPSPLEIDEAQGDLASNLIPLKTRRPA